MQANVKFTPPAVGTTQVPIQITGEGKLQVSESGIEVSGFAPTSQLPNLLGALLGAFGVATLVYFIQQEVTEFVIQVAVVGAITGYFSGQLAPNKSKPVEFKFPWSSITNSTFRNQVLTLTIKKNKPSGSLYVTIPENGDQLNEKIEKHIKEVSS